jgi:flagellar biosynthetic protein FliR
VNDLLAQLTQISGLGQDLIWSAVLVFFRTGAVMALLPAFGEQTVPLRVRLVVALAFTAVVLPSVSERIPAGGFFLPIAVEIAAGLMLGIGLRLFILALQIAGSITAQATSLAQLFGGTGPEPQPAISNLLVVTGLALAAMAGLHVRVAQLLILSYDVIPAGRLPTGVDVAQWGVFQIGRAFSLGFSLAAPFTIAALLYNVAIGAINRAMPALMVSFVGAPALTGGGLLLLAILAPVILGVWHQSFQGFLVQPFRAIP